MPPVVRRTQQARRESTIRKILDAATHTLIEHGYAGATMQEVSERAAVSQGGLFRHFPTREALMVAVAEDIGNKLLARFRKQFGALSGREEPIMAALTLLREHCGSRINQAWYELAIASRTDAGLRKALRPIGARYYVAIEALARELLPDLAEMLGDEFGVVVDTVIAIFDGEVVHRSIARRPHIEERRIALLKQLLDSGLIPRSDRGLRAGADRARDRT